jgi:hypothetical protein
LNVDDAFGPPMYDTPQGFVAAHLLALSDLFDRRLPLRPVWDEFTFALLRDLPPGWEDRVADSFHETALVLEKMACRVRAMK